MRRARALDGHLPGIIEFCASTSYIKNTWRRYKKIGGVDVTCTYDVYAQGLYFCITSSSFQDVRGRYKACCVCAFERHDGSTIASSQIIKKKCRSHLVNEYFAQFNIYNCIFNFYFYTFINVSFQIKLELCESGN